MRQLTCIAPGRLEWRDVPAPTLSSDHAALVRPLAVARCDIDVFLAQGLFPAGAPFALGHECVGEVVALGDSVRRLAVGDRVVVSFQLSCGSCRSCRAGHSASCEAYPLLSDYGMQPLSGVEYGGMLSDLVAVPYAEAMLSPCPGADPVSLASVSDNVLDGFRAVAPHLAAQPNADVLVVSHGYPSIPLYAVMAARALGAGEVHFASDDDERLALAERLGARPVRTDFERPLRRYPIVVEGGLTTSGLTYAIRATENEGVCQSVSYFPARDLALPLGSMYTRGIRFFIGRTNAASLLPTVVPLILQGKLSPEAVTTRVVSADEAPLAWVEPAIKLVVRMN
jgi:threonine dehydrogenase-like Zn-dependent dehydrogenase